MSKIQATNTLFLVKNCIIDFVIRVYNTFSHLLSSGNIDHMNSTHKKKLLVLLTLFLVHLIAYAAKPNVVLMMSDDQGWGDVGYNGHAELKTPHLDQMSKEGIIFSRFYSANAMCSPTRGSVYTGRHPYRYGITFAMKGMLEPYEITLSQVLKKAGYTTGHFGKWHLGTLTKIKGDQKRWGAFSSNPERYFCPPWERDVDVCFVTESKVPTWDPMVNPGNIKKGSNKTIVSDKPYGNEYFTGPGQKATQNLEGDDSRVLMDRAIPFIQNAAKEKKPFLAVIWFHAPHSPVVAGPAYRAMYKGLSIEKQHYYGCIMALDEQVGRLRSELKNLKIADNTIVTFCSDNGPARQGSPRQVGTSKNLTGYKLSLREGGIRVPGLMVWPAKFAKPRTVTTPCVTTDYFPTILAALDIPLPSDRPYDGKNILPYIENTELKRTSGIGFLHNKGAWIEHRYKLYTQNGRNFKLYDIIDDPSEKKDLSKKFPEVKQRLIKDFNVWQTGVVTDLEKIK
jgi:arylsulfatase A-like enzyme